MLGNDTFFTNSFWGLIPLNGFIRLKL